MTTRALQPPAHGRSGGAPRWARALIAASILISSGFAISSTFAQVANPVYVDDSPAASDTFSRIRDHLATGNLTEAVRVIQVLLDDMPDRVVPVGASDQAGAKQPAAPLPPVPQPVNPPVADPNLPVPQGPIGPSIGIDDRDLFRSVRSQAHRVLIGSPELLAQYRAIQEPAARALLEQGNAIEVERSYLMTTSGFEAALRVAQAQLEDARFRAALLTLKQLESHPDRKGAGAADAAKLAASVARYLSDPDAIALAARWAGVAPAEFHVSPVTWPPVAKIEGLSPIDPAGPVDLAAVLGKPLRSAPITEDPASVLPPTALMLSESERLPSTARILRVMPEVAGDTLYLNSGTEICALDRITLARKWIVRGDAAGMEDTQAAMQAIRQATRGNMALEEPSTVAVAGRTAVGAMGWAIGNIRWGDPRVFGIDTINGRVKWAVRVDDLDPQLEGLFVRGPIVISEGTAVVMARRSVPERRIVAAYEIGLDVERGTLKWFRMMGSTGALPYKHDPYVSDGPVCVSGVIYRTDMLGVVTATEAESGRPVWVRRMPPLTSQVYDQLMPWHVASPVIDGDSLIVLSGDRREIVRLNRETGELKSWCYATKFDPQGLPRYLLRAGSSLGVVYDNRIAFVPIDSFDSATPVLSPRIAEPGINGHVIATGSKLIVPTSTGLHVIDATKPELEPAFMPLDNPGNVMALQSQLLVVDDVRVHSYLLWEVAEQLLSQRMKDDPSDPTASVTLAELAYRAAKPERILAAVDAALAAFALKPDADQTTTTKARLFTSLENMVSASVEPTASDGHVADATPESAAPKIADNTLLVSLVDRMKKVAITPDEQLACLLAAGRLNERLNKPTEAMDLYQSILDDDKLSTATWSGPRLLTRGELEVTRRMEQLVQEKGLTVYASHDARARDAAAKLSAEASPDDLISLATRYPVSSITWSLWTRVADEYKRRGRDHGVVGALESALEAAQRLPGSPAEPVPAVAGRLVTELESRQQFAAAGNVLHTMVEKYPGIKLTLNGAAVDMNDVADRLMRQIAARQRWPKIGELRADGVQLIPGWSIVEPLMRIRSGVSPHGVVMKNGETIALWSPTAVAPASTPGDLSPVWQRPNDAEVTELVRLDSEAAYFFFATSKGATIEKVATSPPGSRWQTPLFADLQPTRQPASRNRRDMAEAAIATPQDGVSFFTDGVIAMDDRTMVFVERQGHATAIDTQTGAVLWTIRTPLDRVYDVCVGGGTLVVAGDQEVPAAQVDGVARLKADIVVMDARTGLEVQRLPQRWGGVRWVRLMDSGVLISGCENAIVATELSRAQVNWVISDPHLSGSRDAWIFQNSIFVLDRDRRLWWADGELGKVSAEALDAPRGRLDGVRRIDAALIPPKAGAAGSVPVVAFSTYQGVLLYDLKGNLKGVDAVGGIDGVLPPVPAQDRLFTIGSMPDGRRPDGDLLYTIHVLDTTSAMVMESVPIVLGVPPRSIMLMDGKVVLTAGGATIVLQAP